MESPYLDNSLTQPPPMTLLSLPWETLLLILARIPFHRDVYKPFKASCRKLADLTRDPWLATKVVEAQFSEMNLLWPSIDQVGMRTVENLYFPVTETVNDIEKKIETLFRTHQRQQNQLEAHVVIPSYGKASPLNKEALRAGLFLMDKSTSCLPSPGTPAQQAAQVSLLSVCHRPSTNAAIRYASMIVLETAKVFIQEPKPYPDALRPILLNFIRLYSTPLALERAVIEQGRGIDLLKAILGNSQDSESHSSVTATESQVQPYNWIADAEQKMKGDISGLTRNLEPKTLLQLHHDSPDDAMLIISGATSRYAVARSIAIYKQLSIKYLQRAQKEVKPRYAKLTAASVYQYWKFEHDRRRGVVSAQDVGTEAIAVQVRNEPLQSEEWILPSLNSLIKYDLSEAFGPEMDNVNEILRRGKEDFDKFDSLRDDCANGTDAERRELLLNVIRNWQDA